MDDGLAVEQTITHKYLGKLELLMQVLFARQTRHATCPRQAHSGTNDWAKGLYLRMPVARPTDLDIHEEKM
jgi:hypothetical protein